MPYIKSKILIMLMTLCFYIKSFHQCDVAAARLKTKDTWHQLDRDQTVEVYKYVRRLEYDVNWQHLLVRRFRWSNS